MIPRCAPASLRLEGRPRNYTEIPLTICHPKPKPLVRFARLLSYRSALPRQISITCCRVTRHSQLYCQLHQSFFYPGMLALRLQPLNITTSNNGNLIISQWPSEVRDRIYCIVYRWFIEYSSSLQKQAIEKARSSFSRLPRGDPIFQQCIDQADSIPDVVKSVIQTSRSYKERQSARLFRKFEQHAHFLQNASDIVDIVVQTQAGIGCPLWAPVKFVLKVWSCPYQVGLDLVERMSQVSKDHAQVAEQVLNLIEVISENHHRFEIYGKLPPDPILQIALLNIFTDVVEFSVRAFRLFRGSTRGLFFLHYLVITTY